MELKKSTLKFLLMLAAITSSLQAEVITPIDATSTTSYDAARPITDAFDGTLLSSGGTSGNILSETVGGAGNDGHWLSASNAVTSGTTSATEILTFDLGGTYDVDAVHLWPYIRSQASRGLSSFTLSFSSDGTNFTDSITLSSWTIGPTTGTANVETKTFTAVTGVTHLRMTDLTTHGSTGFIAISEIRFGGTSVSTPAGPVDAGNSTVAASPTTMLADGSSTSTITVTLKDAVGIPVSGEDVTLTNTAGPGAPTISPSATQTTNGTGEATFTVSSNTVGTETFTATSATDGIVVTQTADVEFQDLIVDASNSTVIASPTAVPADGFTTSTITVTIINSGGLPLPGKVVSLTGNSSAIVETTDNTSDASGIVIFTVKSSTVGIETFTAESESVTITNTANVDFESVPVAGAVDAGNSTVVASPTTVPGDGSTTSTITVTLKDSTGLAVSGEDVTLANTSGPGTPVISPSNTQTTDINGVATFTVSSTTGGTEVFSATSATDNILISQTASVEFTQIGAEFLVTLLSNPISATTSATPYNSGSIVEDLYDTAMSLDYIGTRNNEGGAFLAATKDSDGYTGDTLKSHIVIYDMGQIVSFDGFIHAQRHESALSSVGTIEFWVINTDPGSDFTAIANNYFGTTPDASKTLNNGDRNLHEYILDEGTLTGRYLIMRWICYDQDSDAGNPGGYTFLLGQTATVSDYDTWVGSYPGLGLPGDDDDDDGLSNDKERMFGLNPTDPESANPYAVPFDHTTGTFSYTRRTQSLTGLTYKTWYSTNLVDWFWDSASSETPGTPVGNVETVGVSIDPDLLTEPKLFVRVGAEDLGPPPVVSSLWGSNASITINFSEEMTGSSAIDPANYTVDQDGGGSIAVIGATLSGDGKTVTLSLGSSLAIDSAFTVTMNRISNGAGQPLGNGTTKQFQTWDNDPSGIKVFILAGQSNMVGYGHSELGYDNVTGAIGSLRYLAVNNSSYPEYDYSSLLENPSDPANSAWATRSDVKIWWKNGVSGELDGPLGKGDLGPPFRGANTNWFGPEYAFGQIIGDYYDSDDVLIIKTCWGGHKLAEDFRPPSAVAARGGAVGASYNEIFDDARQVLLNLDTEFPEWSGRGYEIVGFAWHQGTSDKSPIERSNEYKYNLPDLIGDVRAEFGKPELPFVIATTGMSNVGPVEPFPYVGYHDVEKAQLWVAGVTQPANVLTDDTRGYWETSVNSPMNQAYHWNHNARSYFQVGKGLADNMVILLTP